MTKHVSVGMFCVVLSVLTLFPAAVAQAEATVRATDASAGPGGTDTVDVVLEVTPFPPWHVRTYDVTLAFDDGVLVQPTELDITSGAVFEGFMVIFVSDTSVGGEARVGLTIFFPPGVTVASSPMVLFSVSFEVQGSPSSSSSSLSITSVDVLDDVNQSVGATAGPDGMFTVSGVTPTLEIIPSAPEVSVDEYLNFRIMTPTPTPSPAPFWSLAYAGSRGSIEVDSGVYQAGETPGEDVVDVWLGGALGRTNATVTASPRTPGTVGPPTSMDVDGGGVGLSDVIRLLKHVVGVETLTAEQIEAGDFDCNGSIGLADVLNALRVVVGLEPVL